MAKTNQSVSDIICSLIKKQKLLPIPVQSLNEEVVSTRYFCGNLKEFLAAAKTLGTKGIFVEELYLEEDEFFYDSGIDDEEYLAMNNSCCCTCNCGCDENCKCGCQDKKKSKKESKEKIDGIWLEPEDLDGLDLSLLRPEIAKFQERIGECCGVRLTIPGADRLEVEIFADWYDKFAELVDEASEIIEWNPNGALKQMQSLFETEEKPAKAKSKKKTKK